MTDDLVRRLRKEDPECGLRHSIAMEAADRIETLEAALRYYAKDYENPFGGDDSLVARAALAGEKKDE